MGRVGKDKYRGHECQGHKKKVERGRVQVWQQEVRERQEVFGDGQEGKWQEVGEESPRKRREKTPVDLDKIVIKKREKKQQEEKSADEKVLVVRTPNSLMGRLAELRKALPRPQEEPAEKSEEERTVVRRSLREKSKE